MSGSVAVVGHRGGKGPSGCDLIEQARELASVIGYPLQRRVREHQVEGLVRLPGADVGGDPLPLGKVVAGGGEHRLRGVHPGQRGARPATGEDSGARSRTAAEIDDSLGRIERDAGGEVDGRLKPLFLEPKIEGGVPGRHGRANGTIEATRTRRTRGAASVKSIMRLTCVIVLWAAGFCAVVSRLVVVAAADGAMRVEGGLISGVTDTTSGVRAFKGIPFAAPPTGDLRWRPPAPVRPWEG